MEDRVYWSASSTGAFSLKSAISLLKPPVHTGRAPPWVTLWKVRASQRVKVFTWLVLHGRLMTNLNRFKRGLTHNPNCSICEQAQEDVEHVLRLCPEARHIWQTLAMQGLGQLGTDLNFEDWFRLNISNVGGDGDWPSKFLITLWYIWKWRNIVCFEGTNLSVHGKVRLLLSMYTEHLEALQSEDEGQSVPAHPTTTLVRWEAAPEGWSILNTDGASKGNPGPAGCGGVLRGDRGEWKWGFAMNTGHCSSMKAEIMAVLKGIQVAKERGVQKLWIRSDSCVLVGILRGAIKSNPVHGSLIQRCKVLLSDSNWETKVTHCFREANQVANILANKGVSKVLGITVYHLPPVET